MKEYVSNEQTAKKMLDTYLQKHELTKKGLKHETNKYKAKQICHDTAWVLSFAVGVGFGCVALGNGDTIEFEPVSWSLFIGGAISTIALTMQQTNSLDAQRLYIAKLSNKYHKKRLAQNRAVYLQKTK